MTGIHDDIAEAADFCSTHILGEEITNHLVCLALIDGDMLALGHVCDEEIQDVHVVGVYAAGRPPIYLQ